VVEILFIVSEERLQVGLVNPCGTLIIGINWALGIDYMRSEDLPESGEGRERAKRGS